MEALGINSKLWGKEKKKEKKTIESFCLHEEIGENEKPMDSYLKNQFKS